jgi:hypothetical protein
MTTAKKTAKKAAVVTMTPATVDNPDTQTALEQMAATAVSSAQESEAPKRRRRSADQIAAEMPEVDIDQELLENPGRMNYVLLLALLSKLDGRAEFGAKDLDIADDEFNVVFAKSLDRKKMVVSIVSAQSGILKSPAVERGNQWTTSQPYNPPPTLSDMEEHWTRTGRPNVAEDAHASPKDMLSAALPEPTPQERFLQAAAQEEKAAAEKAEVAHPFPFEVGDRPQTATAVDLGAYAAQQVRMSNQVEEDQQAAAERVENLGR